MKDQKINPLEWLQGYDGRIDHIKFDPNVKADYRIIRQYTHDGTLAHIYNLIAEAMAPLLKMESYFKLDEPDWTAVCGFEYVIGDIDLKHGEGMLNLGDLQFKGMVSTVTIPVKCVHILKERNENP